MVIIFTARFNNWILWLLASLTMITMNTLSTCIGYLLKLIIPPFWVSLIVVILFLGFGTYMLTTTFITCLGCCKKEKKPKGDDESSSEDEEAEIEREWDDYEKSRNN